MPVLSSCSVLVHVSQKPVRAFQTIYGRDSTELIWIFLAAQSQLPKAHFEVVGSYYRTLKCSQLYRLLSTSNLALRMLLD